MTDRISPFAGKERPSGSWLVQWLIERKAWLETFKPAHRRQRRLAERFYATFIKPGDLVYDVGANVGDRTSIFARLGARTIAIEPQPACVKRLKQRFGRHPNVTIVPTALGARTGTIQLHLSRVSKIASAAPEWIDKVRQSGRFATYEWSDKLSVPLQRLDDLIAQFGRPDFCKIDVEGYEAEVLKGLTEPIRFVSFEFTPEHIQPAVNCIRYLDGLNRYRFNYSLGESMIFAQDTWQEAKAICLAITSLPDASVFGDVYARLDEPENHV